MIGALAAGSPGIGERTPLLSVRGLSVRFHTDAGLISAVTDASFELAGGECLAVVGESGSGKSVMAHALLGLLPANAELGGEAFFDGTELIGARETLLAGAIRGRRIGLAPQSPAAHLTPVRTARAQLEEALSELTGDGTSDHADALARRVGLDPGDLDLYPHELSGGMAQRVALALALAGDPDLVLADEPTGGLDRNLIDQAMTELRRCCEEGRSVLLITHDLAAAERVADRVAVMYGSRLVEISPAGAFFDRPLHPYAEALLEALPQRGFRPIPGSAPEASALPPGCPFVARCPLVEPQCAVMPPLSPVGDRLVACYPRARGG